MSLTQKLLCGPEPSAEINIAHLTDGAQPVTFPLNRDRPLTEVSTPFFQALGRGSLQPDGIPRSVSAAHSKSGLELHLLSFSTLLFHISTPVTFLLCRLLLLQRRDQPFKIYSCDLSSLRVADADVQPELKMGLQMMMMKVRQTHPVPALTAKIKFSCY